MEKSVDVEYWEDASRSRDSDRDYGSSYDDYLDDMETKSHTNVVSDLINTTDGQGVWAAEQSARIDLFTLKELFHSEPWVYITVNSTARKVSKQHLKIWRELIVDGSSVEKPAEEHPLQALIERPNSFESSQSFKYKMFAELCLMGNCIIWKTKRTGQLLILPTELVQLEFNDQTGELDSYLFLADGIDTLFLPDGSRTKMRIPAKEIIHIRLPNLRSHFFGLSPFVPGRKSVLFDRYSSEYLLTFYQKQASPGMVLEIGEGANEKQAIRMLKSFENMYTGRRNQRRTMITPKGVKAQSLAHTLAEQELKEHIELKRDEILGLLNFPRHELGLQESGSIGSNETNQQLKNFWESTLIPFQDLVADSFNLSFETALGEKFFFKFDNSNVAVLQEDLNEKAQLAISLKETWTVNEIRKELFEKPELEDGDRIFTPGNAPGQESLSASMNPPTLFSDSEEPVRRKTSAFLNKNSDWWNARQKQENDGVEKAFDKMVDASLELLSNFAISAIKTVRKHFKDIPAEKADDGDTPKEVRKRELRRQLQREFDTYGDSWTSDSSGILEEQVELGYDLQLNTPFNLPPDNELNVLRGEGQEGRRASLNSRLVDSFENIADSNTDKVLDIISNGVDEQKTVQQIAQDIAGFYEDEDNIKFRSERIARTETLTAVSLGQQAASKDVASVLDGVKQVWVTVGDGRVRKSHEALDGEAVDVDEEFSNGLRYPRDPKGDPEDVIQCRCTTLLVPDEDLAELFPSGEIELPDFGSTRDDD